MEIEEIQTAINALLNRIDALEQKNAALEGEQKNIQATLEARIEAEQKEKPGSRPNRRSGSCPSSSLHSWNRGMNSGRSANRRGTSILRLTILR